MKKENNNQNQETIIPYFQVKNKMIVIEFDKIFDLPHLEKYNYFHMTYNSKRFYADNAETFANGCNSILSQDPKMAQTILYQYLTLKRTIDEKSSINYKTFISVLMNLLFTYKPNNGQMNFLDAIKLYIDTHYINHINPFYEQNAGKYEQAIMFFERHYKILFEVSYLSQFIIPISMHYLYNNPSIGFDADSFIYLVIMELMKIVTPVIENDKKVDIYTKLYRHVQKYMDKTQVTDKQGMTRLQIYGVTADSTIDAVMKKLLTNILPRYKFDEDIMKFNQSVIRTSIEVYTLRKKDPIPARCLISDSENFNDEDDNGMELFDQFNKSRNEKMIFYRKSLSGRTMEKIAQKYNIFIPSNEMDFYRKNIEITPLQINLISQVFAKDFGGVENISGCNEQDMIYGIVILHKRMLKLNLINLANLILAKKTYSVLNKTQSKNILKKIEAHPLYEKIINSRYKFVKGLFLNKIVAKNERNHPMVDLLKIIMNDNYVYNGFGDPDNGKIINKNEDDIINEVLNIYLTLIF